MHLLRGEKNFKAAQVDQNTRTDETGQKKFCV